MKATFELGGDDHLGDLLSSMFAHQAQIVKVDPSILETYTYEVTFLFPSYDHYFAFVEEIGRGPIK